MVTVSDSDIGSGTVPSGTVTFTENAGGSFVPLTCTLSAGSCSVTYNPPAVILPTTVTISATYSGDIDHVGGSGSTTVQVT
jgi:hypothetical protein